MAEPRNCSFEPPVSEVYLSEVSDVERALIGVSTLLCVAVLLLFVDMVVFIFRFYGNEGRPRLIRNMSAVLVGLYPVTAVTSMLAVYIPRSTYLGDFISNVYLALCLYEFTSLLVLYFGGRGELVEAVGATGFSLRTPPLCCCCPCPALLASQRTLSRLQLMVLQTACIQPIVSFVSLVLWADGKYKPSATRASAPATYLSAVSGVSTITAIYGLEVLFRGSRRYLATHSVTPKFVLLQMVLVVQAVQGMLLTVLAEYGLPPCVKSLGSSVRANAIHHMLVIAEMCLLAFLARYFYRKSVMKEDTLEGTFSDDSKEGMPRGSINNPVKPECYQSLQDPRIP